MKAEFERHLERQLDDLEAQYKARQIGSVGKEGLGDGLRIVAGLCTGGPFRSGRRCGGKG